MRVSSFSSIVDYPHIGLPKDLWRIENNEYILKDAVSDDIKHRVYDFCERYALLDVVVDIYLASSVTTSYHTKSSDLDVKIVIDLDKYMSSLTLTSTKDEVIDDLVASIREDAICDDYVYGTSREFDPYFYEKGVFSPKKSDGIYSVLQSSWLSDPLIVDIDSLKSDDLDLEERFEEGYKQAKKWASSWDGDLGDLRRDIKEFDYIVDYLKSLPVEYKKKFKSRLEVQLDKINEVVDDLVDDFIDIRDARHDVFKDESVELPEYANSINFLPENVRWKLLQRWGYTHLLWELKNMIEDGLSASEIGDIKTFMRDELF